LDAHHLLKKCQKREAMQPTENIIYMTPKSKRHFLLPKSPLSSPKVSSFALFLLFSPLISKFSNHELNLFSLQVSKDFFGRIIPSQIPPTSSLKSAGPTLQPSKIYVKYHDSSSAAVKKCLKLRDFLSLIQR
jgi:hypothetical protein